MKSKKILLVAIFFLGCAIYAQTPVNDVGILGIASPQSGNGLANEIVSVTIKNYGSNSQSNFEVQYTVDSNAPVMETFMGPIAPNEEIIFDFTIPADLSIPGTYFLVARTNLAGDEDQSNDANGNSVVNSCIPLAFEGCFVDGIKRFVLNTIDVDDGGDGCNTEPSTSPEGYANRTTFSTALSNSAGTNVHTLQVQQNWDNGANVEQLSVWIDFNDNLIFEVSERLISGAFFQTFDVLEDFTLTIPIGAPIGAHILRAKAIDSSGPGDILNPCTNYGWGETQDYTVVIESVLSNAFPLLSEVAIMITSLPENSFEITMNHSYRGLVTVEGYNLWGQKVLAVDKNKDKDKLSVKLDMSNSASGVYLLRVTCIETATQKVLKIVTR